MTYGQSFEKTRRLSPRIWDADYCLLVGLRNEVHGFAQGLPGNCPLVIDYGCGAKPYRELFPRSCSYLGVDVCDNPWADLLARPGEEIPTPSSSADAVISTQVVYLIRDYSAYLQECHRVLKPGGWLLLTTHGTWTYHPASGADYYRFTQDGIKAALEVAGFEVSSIRPIVGTLGTGLHLRQLVFNSWLKRLHLRWVANALNILTNVRILIEDAITPKGSRMAAPVILACIARAR